MTLEITAYRQLRLTDLTQGGTIENPHDIPPCHLTINVNKSYPQRCADLEDGMIYRHGGIMSVAHWSAGSYDQWRNELARLAGYPEVRNAERDPENRRTFARGAWETHEGPFWELINFSDQEGMLGTATCQKLLRDFDEHVAIMNGSRLPFFPAFYLAIHGGLRFASESGCLEFS